ncbi:MAG: Ig domain-containing protein [Desulfobacteraceae bacterium]|jgi:hypothetical protein
MSAKKVQDITSLIFYCLLPLIIYFLSGCDSHEPPVLEPVGDQTAQPGSPLKFSVNVKDPALSSDLTYSIVNISDDIDFTPYFDSLTRTFNWTPTINDEGSYQVKFNVCDTYNSVAQCAQEVITINVESASSVRLNSPTLLTPADNAVMDNGCTTTSETQKDPIIWAFAWSIVENATKYQISISNEEKELINKIVTTPGYTYNCLENSDEIPDCDIQNSDGYLSWRVRAGYGEGDGQIWSDWSKKREFTIEPLDTDCADYAYLIKFNDAWPPSPSPIAPDSDIKLHFNYYTPYYLGAYVKIVPYFEGNPWPEGLYRPLDEIHYPPAYDGRIVEVDLHITAAAGGKKIDKLYFEIQNEDKDPKELYHIPVEYTVDEN